MWWWLLAINAVLLWLWLTIIRPKQQHGYRGAVVITGTLFVVLSVLVGQLTVSTGAGKGLGEVQALHLAKSGFTVFAGVRSETDMKKLQSKFTPSNNGIHAHNTHTITQSSILVN